MKRRQHVGKKRHRTRVRRKARRDGKRGAVGAMLATNSGSQTPRLTPGTQISHDCYVADLDGVMWHMQPSRGIFNKVNI